MGKLLGLNKAAKKNSAATLESAKQTAAASDRATAANRVSAEAQAAQTGAIAEANRLASDRQSLQIQEQTAAYTASSERQAMLIQQQGEDQMAGMASQTAMIAAQGKAAKETALQQAADQKDQFRSGIQEKENKIAQQVALDKAKEVLNKAPESVQVTLASDTPDQSVVDPQTGRRRPVRAAFMSARANGSGISI